MSDCADIPSLDLSRMSEIVRELMSIRPKVDCFLMMKVTADNVFAGESVFEGLPLHIARTEVEYKGILRSLNKMGLRVGVIAGDIPSYESWNVVCGKMSEEELMREWIQEAVFLFDEWSYVPAAYVDSMWTLVADGRRFAGDLLEELKK